MNERTSDCRILHKDELYLSYNCIFLLISLHPGGCGERRKFVSKNMKRKYLLAYLSIDGRMILERASEKFCLYGPTEFSWLRMDGNEPSDRMETGILLKNSVSWDAMPCLIEPYLRFGRPCCSIFRVLPIPKDSNLYSHCHEDKCGREIVGLLSIRFRGSFYSVESTPSSYSEKSRPFAFSHSMSVWKSFLQLLECCNSYGLFFLVSLPKRSKIWKAVSLMGQKICSIL
jgi:hypothetical protein